MTFDELLYKTSEMQLKTTDFIQYCNDKNLEYSEFCNKVALYIASCSTRKSGDPYFVSTIAFMNFLHDN